VELGDGSRFRLQTVEQLLALLGHLGQVDFELLAKLLLLLEGFLGLGGLVFQSLDLILDSADVEQRLDLLPQTVPGPVAELTVFAQVALDNLEGNTVL